jgi:two-component system CheB/CheR fusion protein
MIGSMIEGASHARSDDRTVDCEGALKHGDPLLRGSTILVIDDDLDTRDVVRRLLESLGARVVVAENGRDGLSRLASTPPHAVLCDLGMPVMDGLEFARRVRRDPRYRQVLLFALTGWQDHGDFLRSWEAGFDAHLVKPVTMEMLESLARRLFDRDTRREQAGA